ncbi:MAG: ribulose-phosphate 3-epimerase [Fimbriimonadaceae bacterium]
MIQIAPSILSSDFSRFREAVVEFADAGADWIHFDVMDGQFVPPITFGAKLVADLRDSVSIPFEAHLMTQTPDAHFDSFIQAGCKRIIFHAEATDHTHRLCQQLRKQGVQAGIAINPGTPAEVVEPLLDLVDLVLVMTVNPGWGGQSFISTALDKVRKIRSWSAVDIEIDGGVDPNTIAGAYAAGVNVFVTGSFLASSPDVKSSIQELRAKCSA